MDGEVLPVLSAAIQLDIFWLGTHVKFPDTSVLTGEPVSCTREDGTIKG